MIVQVSRLGGVPGKEFVGLEESLEESHSVWKGWL